MFPPRESDEPLPTVENHAVLATACKPVTLPAPRAGENGPTAEFVILTGRGSGSKVQFAMIDWDCAAIVVSANAARMAKHFFTVVFGMKEMGFW